MWGGLDRRGVDGASLDSLVCSRSADGGRPDLLWGRRLGHRRRLQLEKNEQILHTKQLHEITIPSQAVFGSFVGLILPNLVV